MKVEVAVPCYNEEQTVGKVVADFRAALPDADVVVYDNLSRDQTAREAVRAGARVVPVYKQGKGYVVREILDRTAADIVILVDGDDTYEAADVGKLIDGITAGHADMVVGTRLHSDPGEFRRFHHWGNQVITRLMNMLFGCALTDVLSGYRAFGRTFRETIALISEGFDIEVEMTIKGLAGGMNVSETPIRFRNRPAGNPSKLSTFKDGYRIILTIVSMLRDYRPLFMFSVLGLILAGAGTVTWIVGYIGEPRHALYAVLRHVGVLCVVASGGVFVVGLILNTVNVRMRELAALINRRRHGP